MHVWEAAISSEACLPILDYFDILDFLKLQTKYLGTSKNIVNLDVKYQMQPFYMDKSLIS